MRAKDYLGKTQIDDMLIVSSATITKDFLCGQNENTNYRAVLHCHSDAELFCCEIGQIQIKTQNEIYDLSAGDVAIVPTNLPHVKMPHQSVDAKWMAIGVYCFECDSKSHNKICRKANTVLNANQVIIVGNKPQFYHEIMDFIKHSSTKDAAVYHFKFASSFYSLINEINLPKGENRTVKNTHSKNFDKKLKIEDYINSHNITAYTSSVLAKELFISERHLARIVKEIYGTTLRLLLVKKKISDAAYLLTTTNCTVEEISVEVGFNNKKSFHKEFKKQYNTTPLQYRKQNSK